MMEEENKKADGGASGKIRKPHDSLPAGHAMFLQSLPSDLACCGCGNVLLGDAFGCSGKSVEHHMSCSTCADEGCPFPGCVNKKLVKDVTIRSKLDPLNCKCRSIDMSDSVCGFEGTFKEEESHWSKCEENPASEAGKSAISKELNQALEVIKKRESETAHTLDEHGSHSSTASTSQSSSSSSQSSSSSTASSSQSSSSSNSPSTRSNDIPSHVLLTPGSYSSSDSVPLTNTEDRKRKLDPTSKQEEHGADGERCPRHVGFQLGTQHADDEDEDDDAEEERRLRLFPRITSDSLLLTVDYSKVNSTQTSQEIKIGNFTFVLAIVPPVSASSSPAAKKLACHGVYLYCKIDGAGIAEVLVNFRIVIVNDGVESWASGAHSRLFTHSRSYGYVGVDALQLSKPISKGEKGKSIIDIHARVDVIEISSPFSSIFGASTIGDDQKVT